MNELESSFLAYLQRLKAKDRGALARLRRSLAHDPGTDPQTYPYVEPFVGSDWHVRDGRRLALHLGAGLFALNPWHDDQRTLAAAFGAVASARGSASLEPRFMALLGADADQFPALLRQVVNLLDGVGYDQIRLIADLRTWLDTRVTDRRDRLRQAWARDFYCHYTPFTH